MDGNGNGNGYGKGSAAWLSACLDLDRKFVTPQDAHLQFHGLEPVLRLQQIPYVPHEPDLRRL